MSPASIARLAAAAALISAAFIACRHAPAGVAGVDRPEVWPDGGVVSPEEMARLTHVEGDCHPTPGAKGNAQHVGQYCTLHGDQCADNPGGSANACAVDLDARGGNYCIRVFCSTSDECGPAACCYGDPGGLAKACIPAGCVSDAGVCPR